MFSMCWAASEILQIFSLIIPSLTRTFLFQNGTFKKKILMSIDSNLSSQADECVHFDSSRERNLTVYTVDKIKSACVSVSKNIVHTYIPLDLYVRLSRNQ